VIRLLRNFGIVALTITPVFLAVLLPASAAMSDLPGWKAIPTKQSYADLVESLNQAVKQNKMGLVTKASATVGAKKMLDKDIAGNMVVGVYRPDFAVRMLEASIAAGIEAPIRFYITENDDGTATLSYKTPSSVFAPYTDGGDKLKEMAGELDEIFSKIAADATTTE